MFPKCNVRFRSFGGTSVREKSLPPDEKGVVLRELRPCNTKLPSHEFNKISNMVKAGITLKEVPTAVISDLDSERVDAAVNAVFDGVKKSRSVKPSDGAGASDDTTKKE